MERRVLRILDEDVMRVSKIDHSFAAVEHVALEARVAVGGRDDATILESVENAFLRALAARPPCGAR